MSNNNNEKTFIDFLIVLVKWRKFLIVNVLFVTILSVGVSFLLDKWYTSTANIIPPKSKGGLLGDIGNFSSTIKDISKTLGRLGSTSTEAYDYLAILQSRTSFEKVINKFELREVYEYDNDDPIEEIIQELEDNVKFQVEDEGNITISVTDKSADRAAKMANYFVSNLNEISIELGKFEAKNNREFIETRYFQVLVDLKNAEDSLKKFSKKFSIYSIADQTKATISAAAELQAQIEVQKVEYILLKQNYGENHPICIDKLLIIAEMEKRLTGMNYSDINNDKKVKFFTPFAELPEIGTQYIRYKREFELQSKLLEFLLPLYEQAKIEEKKSIPVCVVIDNAVPAQKKSSPKRVFIVVATFLLTSMLSIFFVLTIESFERLKLDQARFEKLNNGIFIPVKRLFFKKNMKNA